MRKLRFRPCCNVLLHLMPFVSFVTNVLAVSTNGKQTLESVDLQFQVKDAFAHVKACGQIRLRLDTGFTKLGQRHRLLQRAHLVRHAGLPLSLREAHGAA